MSIILIPARAKYRCLRQGFCT